MYDDDEEREKLTNDAMLVYNLFGMTLDQFDSYVGGVIHGFKTFGNKFLQHLSQVLIHSDLPNTIKVINCWRKECTEHEMLYKILLAKQKAKADEETANDHQ